MLDRMRSHTPLASIAALILVSTLLPACNSGRSDGVSVTTSTVTSSKSPATQAPAAGRDAVASCVAWKKTGDASLLRVVDKQRALPDGYAPADLVALPDRVAAPGFLAQRMRKDAAEAAVKLLDAAQAQGLDLRAKSTYRSYAEQVRTFQFWVDQHGLAQAKRESAEPGHSEHQTGAAIDVAGKSTGWELEAPFGASPEGKWVALHAAEYGFAISYPSVEAEAITGYEWEPWHLRYIGTTCSKAWATDGMILVKFLEAVAAAG